MSTLKNILSKKTDSQLMFYINNPDKHTEEAVQLALLELKSRGVVIDERIEEEVVTGLEARLQKNELLLDGSYTPPLYSDIAIYIFGTLFTPVFAGGMIAYNRKKVGLIWVYVIFASIGCEVASDIIKNYLKAPIPYGFIMNALGTVLVYYVFWRREVPEQIKYPAKPVWVPLAIALVLFGVGTLLLMWLVSSAMR